MEDVLRPEFLAAHPVRSAPPLDDAVLAPAGWRSSEDEGTSPSTCARSATSNELAGSH